jgi:hypothetical protein
MAVEVECLSKFTGVLVASGIEKGYISHSTTTKPSLH